MSTVNWKPNENYKAFLLYLKVSTCINSVKTANLTTFLPKLVTTFSQLNHEEDLMILFKRTISTFIHKYIYKSADNIENLNKLIKFFEDQQLLVDPFSDEYIKNTNVV